MAAAVSVGLLAALLISPTASAAATKRLRLGFFDPVFTAAPEIRQPWLQRAADAGADIVRLDVPWTASKRPHNPRDPSDPMYDFASADAAVRDAAARGLQVLLSFSGAPTWAEGPDRPAGAPPGSWRPDPAAVADYAAALALRYSGRFEDPAAPGTVLPRATAIQVWNEPNMNTYLTPQWVDGQPASPEIYRSLLNAAYAAVKSVAPEMLVVTAGTAPFGDPQVGGERMRPARFWRTLLCVKQGRRRLRATRTCASPTSFDVIAHNPYPGGPPRWKSAPDDISIAQVGKLKRILDVARRRGRVQPRRRHVPLWVTEVSYDSAPSDPTAIPERRHARFLQETLYLLWTQHVETITWYRILDQEPGADIGETNQSGLYRLDGTVKPAAQAFRFPFVVEPGRRGRLVAWGRSPIAGVVTIERRRNGHWRRVRTLRVRAHGVFLVAVAKVAKPDTLRARVGSERSLAWKR
jgi:hypothetical protein